MPEPKSRIRVAVNGDRAVFRIAGRATFDVAPGFREACEGLWAAGCRSFALELAACETMDSTFLGVMIRLTRRVQAAPGDGVVTLVAMPAKVRDQVASLGVLSFFQVADAPAAEGAEFQAVGEASASKTDLTQVSLEAHQELMSTSAENEKRFKDVAAFLAEDLQRIKGKMG